MSFLNERGKEVGTHNVQRVGNWVGVEGHWFLADDVVAVLPRPHEEEQRPRCEVVMSIPFEGTSLQIVLNASSEDVWKAVAGPPTDNAVTLGASLGKPQEQPAKATGSA